MITNISNDITTIFYFWYLIRSLYFYFYFHFLPKKWREEKIVTSMSSFCYLSQMSPSHPIASPISFNHFTDLHKIDCLRCSHESWHFANENAKKQSNQIKSRQHQNKREIYLSYFMIRISALDEYFASKGPGIAFTLNENAWKYVCVDCETKKFPQNNLLCPIFSPKYIEGWNWLLRPEK